MIKDLLLAQYYDKPNINALIELIEEEFERHTKVKQDIAEKIWPLTAEGKQLDMCGEVADISRVVVGSIAADYFGFPNPGDNTFGRARFYRYGEPYMGSATLQDSEYRLAILGKICKNTTDGSRQDTIDSLKRMFNVSRVVVANAGNAKIRVGVGRLVSRNELAMINALDLVIRGAGVGIIYFFYFNGAKTFGFTRKGRNVGQFAPMGKGAFARILQIEGSLI